MHYNVIYYYCPNYTSACTATTCIWTFTFFLTMWSKTIRSKRPTHVCHHSSGTNSAWHTVVVKYDYCTPHALVAACPSRQNINTVCRLEKESCHLQEYCLELPQCIARINRPMSGIPLPASFLFTVTLRRISQCHRSIIYCTSREPLLYITLCYWYCYTSWCQVVAGSNLATNGRSNIKPNTKSFEGCGRVCPARSSLQQRANGSSSKDGLAT